uniref:Zona pellucida binding protein n=1 Tax=Strix occidentalis caurina TaxID=311401 RepID=A0A8D0FR64_STROC
MEKVSFQVLSILDQHTATSPSPGDTTDKYSMLMIIFFKVYVKLNHNSPCILCLTNNLRNLELIDPVFQWNGPHGGISSAVCKSPTGTLTLKHFNLSGVYTCSIVYKLTAMQPDKKLIIKYLIYGKLSVQVSVLVSQASCNSSRNTSFEKALLQILSEFVAELSCEVTLIKSECHHVKMQRGGLQDEIFTFSVASLDREKHNRLCQQSACDASHRLNKAKHLTERFFKQQVELSRESSEPLPQRYYIEGTLQMVQVDHCSPGYGMNAQVHPDCPECCGDIIMQCFNLITNLNATFQI